jgi:hypothetical protein
VANFTLEQFTNQCFSNDMDLEETNACSLRESSSELSYRYVHHETSAAEDATLLDDLILNEFVLSHFDYFSLF